MATSIGNYFTESDDFIDGRYKLTPDLVDFTWKRRVFYGVNKAGTTVSVTKNNVSSSSATKTFTLTLPTTGTVRGITHNRDFLVGMFQPDTGAPDTFCYWDYSGNLIFSIANRPANIKTYEQLTFLRHHYYVVTIGTNPALCSVFKIVPSSADLVKTFSLSDKEITGITNDGHSLWVINKGSNSIDNFSTSGTLIRQQAFAKALSPGIAFNRRYKLVSF